MALLVPTEPQPELALTAMEACTSKLTGCSDTPVRPGVFLSGLSQQAHPKISTVAERLALGDKGVPDYCIISQGFCQQQCLSPWINKQYLMHTRAEVRARQGEHTPV